MKHLENNKIILNTKHFVKSKFSGETTGHDWWHMKRVHSLSKHIASKIHPVDMIIVEMSALLHDVIDFKLVDDEKLATNQLISWLEQQQVKEPAIKQIISNVKEVSFKGSGVNDKPSSIEAMIIQDADRLDALGAIGIARTFAYGGSANRPIYQPDVKPVEHKSFTEYKSNQSHTINHFYEKLLLLKDRLNTEPAKEIAEEQHQFMVEFLNQFYKEWGKVN